MQSAYEGAMHSIISGVPHYLSSMSEGVHWVSTEASALLHKMPSMVISFAGITMNQDAQNNQERIVLPGNQGTTNISQEASIKVPVAILVTFFFAVLAANWMIFMMYMDSKWDSISSSFAVVDERLSTSVASLQLNSNIKFDSLKSHVDATIAKTADNNKKIERIESVLEVKSANAVSKEDFAQALSSLKEVFTIRLSSIEFRIDALLKQVRDYTRDNRGNGRTYNSRGTDEEDK